MCNNCSEHEHSHSHNPEIIQIMPVQQTLFAAYITEKPLKYAVQTGTTGVSIVPVLFLALMQHGDKSMVEGFFASDVIMSCEDMEGFKGYASSLEDAERLYTSRNI
ncbi:MAG: hypothetical protein HQK70_08845 [Desulfamplus sp.]|nr:hypothetical protein [Desulfamplus sp.]